MARVEIHQVPVLNDNYVYLLNHRASGTCGIVDPAVAGPVIEALDGLGWKPSWVLNTHHHGDHTGANLEFKQRYNCQIAGPRAEADNIPGIDLALGDGDTFRLGDAEATIFDVPGHTSGHIAFWFKDSDALFCGDALFALGCGRVFEGTHEQMWTSLDKLRALPGETRIYCAHEYTEANLRFALDIEPDNAALNSRGDIIFEARKSKKPTVPSSMADELATNPFLRADDPVLQEALGMAGAEPLAVFSEVRTRKDNF